MSSPHSLRQRVDNAIDSLQRTWGHLDLQFLNGGVNFKQCEPIVAALEKCASDVVALVTPTNRPRHPSSIERITSLSDALESIARKYGGILCKTDALHSLVAEHAPADTRAYWSGNREGEIFGWIRQQADVVDVLAPRGILVWTNEADRRIRIVNTNWLRAHADIRRFVMERWHGRRCRFCRIDEIPTSLELEPLAPQKRSGVAFVNGVVQLQVGQVHLHERCMPFWKSWLAVAESYASQEAAEVADREAGRVMGAAPAAPDDLQLDAAAPEGFFHAGTDREQAR